MQSDNEFYEHTIDKVTTEESGWSIHLDDGFSFFVPPYDGRPEAGMVARFYGKGAFTRVRGLMIDGKYVFYRTTTDDEDYFQNQIYGENAEEWLKRWDEGKTVWSIEMGGLGPGYEQAIQVTVAEIIRFMISQDFIAHAWEDNEFWEKDYEKIEQWSFKDEYLKTLGLSGAQWGAAVSVAKFIYKDGPRKVMNDDRVKDRHIQISKNFP